jgi:hypothetical protein
MIAGFIRRPSFAGAAGGNSQPSRTLKQLG